MPLTASPLMIANARRIHCQPLNLISMFTSLLSLQNHAMLRTAPQIAGVLWLLAR
jgi:hypothetical protein